MGFFTAIGTALGFINNNQTASDLAKDLSNGVDVLIYTKEEKVGDAIKVTTLATEAWLRMVEAMKDSEKYRSVTRRFLAVWVVFNLFCMMWLCIWTEFAHTYGWFKTTLKIVKVNEFEFTSLTWTVLKIAGAFQLGWVFATIIVFYFGTHLISFFRKPKV